jgi:hypothetical protein
MHAMFGGILKQPGEMLRKPSIGSAQVHGTFAAKMSVSGGHKQFYKSRLLTLIRGE